MTSFILIAVIAYLLGAIPFSHLVATRVAGVNLREYGSGNLGATNVFRAVGPIWGVLVLLLDMAKGAVAVLAMGLLIAWWPDDQSLPLRISADGWRIIAGLLAAIGHTLSPFMRFKGGKGVATTAGAFFVLAPWPLVSALAVFAVVFAMTRIVSLGSICAAAVLPIATIYFEFKSDDISWTLTIFTLAICSFVIFRHRDNIRRLRQGDEKPLVGGSGGGKEG